MTGLDFRCIDCHVDTRAIDEYYHVHDDVWKASGMRCELGDGMLCIGCLETRLSRRLTSADFSDAPVNRLFRKSVRMLDRLWQVAT